MSASIYLRKKGPTSHVITDGYDKVSCFHSNCWCYPGAHFKWQFYFRCIYCEFPKALRVFSWHHILLDLFEHFSWYVLNVRCKLLTLSSACLCLGQICHRILLSFWLNLGSADARPRDKDFWFYWISEAYRKFSNLSPRQSLPTTHLISALITARLHPELSL